MTIHQKRHLLELLGQDKLEEVVEELLSNNYELSDAQKRLLQGWKQKGKITVSGIERQNLQQRLREIIESVSRTVSKDLDKAMPSAPAPSSPPPAKGGGFIKRNWDKFNDLFNSRSKSSSSPLPADPFALDKDSNSPRSPRMPTRSEKKSTPPPFQSRPETTMESAPPPPPPPIPPAPSPPAPQAEIPTPEPAGGFHNPFQQGKLLYVIPPQMPLNEISACRIRIASEHLRDADLQAGLSEAELANAQAEGIKMTQVMRVELLNHPTDADNFRISSQNNLDQPVFPFTVSEWVFDVVPQRPGQYALLIRVTARINYAGAERSFDLVVLNRAVEVLAGGGHIVTIEESTQPIPDNDWDETDVQFVEQALTNNQIARAIERLANFIQDKDRELHTALLLQQARWNDNSNKLAQGIIATSEWDLMNRQVRYAITQVHEKIRELDFKRDQSNALAEVRRELEQ